MKSMFYTRLAVVLAVCIWSPNAPGQDIKKLSIGRTAEYLDQQADLNLGPSSISPVNGHLFQAVLSKSDEEGSPYRFYIWELTGEGKKVQEWLVYEGTSEVHSVPSHFFPDLHVLPTGEILAVIMDKSGIPAVAKFDAGGKTVFKIALAEHDRMLPNFRRIMPATDGHMFILGALGTRPTIVKADERGQIVFKKTIDLETTGACLDGVQLSDNCFRILGAALNGYVVKWWVVDVNSQGEMREKFVYDNAPWTSLAANIRITHLGSGHTVVVHPVTAEGKTYCYLTAFDDALKKTKEIRLCEVPDYVGSFEIQRHGKDLVIAVVNDFHKVSLYVLDEELKVRAVGDTQGLLPGGPLRYRLAVTDDRALILVQKGSPLPNDRDSIEFGVIDLKGSMDRAQP